MATKDNPAVRRWQNQQPSESGVNAAGRRAAIYIRVSTRKQVSKDVAEDGLSLPAQRQLCYAEAERRKAQVVEEYIERGESATDANRPELMRLVDDVQSLHHIDMLIVPALDRFARYVRDDANLFHELHQAGVELVSVRENIDHSPSGMLLHYIMSAVNEYESRNNGVRTLSGMSQKAKVGGTPGRAPIGYRNVRTLVEGREVRDVEPDPERADHIRWIFETYATGEWTVRDLTEEVNARGLRTLPHGKKPTRPLHYSSVANILSNRYYIGIVTFRGIEYQGRHEQLVDSELFERVQAVLETRSGSGEKQRIHHHYLKSTVFCINCRSRLCITKAKGQYLYFFCVGRQKRHDCSLPYLNVDVVEERIAAEYRYISLPPEAAERAAEALRSELDHERSKSEGERQRQQKRLLGFAEERRKLLQAHYAGAVPLDLLKEEQERIGREVRDARRLLRHAETAFDDVERSVRQALELATNLHAAYKAGGPMVRRLLNQFFFARVLVGVDKIEVELTEHGKALYRYAVVQLLAEPDTNTTDSAANYLRRRAPSLFCRQSSNKKSLAPPTGFEPVLPP